MQRRKFTSGVLAVVGFGLPWTARPALAAGLTGVGEGEATLGLRAALERGVTTAVGLLGRKGGFLDNPSVRIPLPGFLEQAATVAKFTGQQGRFDELVTAMNRAAEAAVPQAKTLLVNAVKSMSVDDARRVLTGGDGSVTRFFEDKTRAPLSVQFLPIVQRATDKVALAQKYNAVASQGVGLGLVSKQDANVQEYVTAKALDGLYQEIGVEEAKIRQDPVGTGSALLSKVFGSLK